MRPASYANQKETLIVDLDGTLLQSDMLHETYWSAFSHDWRIPFIAAATLVQGKAVLKDYLSSASKVDLSILPYDDEL